MKRMLKILVIALALVLGLITYGLYLSPSARKFHRNLSNSNKIVMGMSRDHVHRVMGDPEFTNNSFDAVKNFGEFFDTYSGPSIANGGIAIFYNRDSLVTHVSQDF